MVAGLAAAKTSAGAPWVIWVARVALEPKLNVTVLPDLAWKSLPIWVNASVSDAAAKTVSGLAGDAELASALGSGESAVQPAVVSSRLATAARVTSGSRRTLIMRRPGSRRRRGWT